VKVLILGSNGLVGSSLKRVLDKNQKITEIIASTREDTNLFSLKSTKKLINDCKPDVLVNAAAKVGGIYANNTKRVEFILENLKINTNVLESCIPHENIKIINLGSSCIYPLVVENPIKEESVMSGKLEPTNSPYAMAKLTAIEIGNALSQQYGHNVINLMPTNLYGPNDRFSENDSHVIPGLIFRMHLAKLKKDQSFEIWGSGKPKREFLYVDDLSESINFIIEKNINIDLLNIGSGYEITIKELALKIKDIVGFSGEVSFNTSMPDGIERKFLNSNKIMDLGWSPKVRLEEGLIKTYNWFQKNYKI
jgi:GDP-L-fucose synthase